MTTHANTARIVGKLTGLPTVIELPSGDVHIMFRIAVPRDTDPQRVDSIPCIATAPRLRRSLLSWKVGDTVEVSGAIRCRFYQAGGATRSRVEVEATAARIVRRAPAPTNA